VNDKPLSHAVLYAFEQRQHRNTRPNRHQQIQQRWRILRAVEKGNHRQRGGWVYLPWLRVSIDIRPAHNEKSRRQQATDEIKRPVSLASFHLEQRTKCI